MKESETSFKISYSNIQVKQKAPHGFHLTLPRVPGKTFKTGVVSPLCVCPGGKSEAVGFFAVGSFGRAMKQITRQTEFVHIGRILDDVLKSCRRELDDELTAVWSLWDRVVGAPIADNAKPAAFKGRMLLVHVTSSTWIHQLQFLKKDIIEQVNRALGKTVVEEIKFKIGPV